MSSCVRGYHVYGEIWTATLGEELFYSPEVGNVVDQYAVAVKKESGKRLDICHGKFRACVACLFSEEEKSQLPSPAIGHSVTVQVRSLHGLLKQ